MEETIKFETAKLAKIKGFDNISCNGYYFGTDDLCNVISDKQHKTKDKCLAPTQSQLQKWLRDIHNIHVTVDFYTHIEIKIPVWQVWISGLHNSFNGQTEIIRKRLDALINDVKWLESLEEFNVFKSYEQALETGLFNALELIPCLKDTITDSTHT